MSQESPPHDGVRKRAAETRQDGVLVSPLPFPTPTPTSGAPEVRVALEEATGELLHLILPRHFAPPDIGGSRLFLPGIRPCV